MTNQTYFMSQPYDKYNQLRTPKLVYRFTNQSNDKNMQYIFTVY